MEEGLVYFEDLVVGSKASFGRYEVTREEVIEFAGKYDPQPFHLNDDAAAQTHFGRISASGWHTCAMVMRILVENLTERKQAGLGSPGQDELRWHRPVYPGDVLRVETELLEKKRSRSRPEMGSLRSSIRAYNQNDQLVMSMIGIGLIRVRED
jgi:acyl dehydratase